MFRNLFVILIFSISLADRGWAAVYSLPDNGDTVVGAVQYKVVSNQQTLLDVARQYDLGLNEIVAANPGINPWIPGDNDRVVIPSFFVLPPKPWQGIVINLPEMRLYYFPPESTFSGRRVITMPLSIGKINWQTPVGKFYVKDKIEHPSWTVPQSIIAEHGLERYGDRRVIPPGDEDNPLGDFAIVLNEAGYLIHGTNKPYSIGLRVSHGCIRLYPEDIDVLFDYVDRKTAVRIINQPDKVGKRGRKLYIETHAPLQEDADNRVKNMTPLVQEVVRQIRGSSVPESAWHRMNDIVSDATGLPTSIIDFSGSTISSNTTTSNTATTSAASDKN